MQGNRSASFAFRRLCLWYNAPVREALSSQVNDSFPARKESLLRLVSLLASATEMLAELGVLDQLVGRSHECDYPPVVTSLPLVSTVSIDTNVSSAEIDAQIKQLAGIGPQPQDPALQALSIYTIDTELLQQLRPDVIFTQTQCEVCAVSERDVRRAVSQLIGWQPQIVSLAPHRLGDVWEDMLRVGAAVGRIEQAQLCLQGYQARLEGLRERCEALISDRMPRLAILEWLDPLMGAGNWTPELVRYAGGELLFGEIGQHTPWLSWEELRAADPDVIVLAPCGFTLTRTMQDLPILQAQPAWAQLRAVREKRVYAIDGNAYLNRSGPRLVESAELIGYALWGEQAGGEINLSALQQILPS
jgi:iron complex transport system substrate-binding protein